MVLWPNVTKKITLHWTGTDTSIETYWISLVHQLRIGDPYIVHIDLLYLKENTNVVPSLPMCRCCMISGFLLCVGSSRIVPTYPKRDQVGADSRHIVAQGSSRSSPPTSFQQQQQQPENRHSRNGAKDPRNSRGTEDLWFFVSLRNNGAFFSSPS